MSTDFRKIKMPIFAWSIILIFYLISIIGIIYTPLESITSKIVQRGENAEGFIELIEAVSWCSAFVIYCLLLVNNLKINRWGWSSMWLLFFTIFCFVALGEEVSWGQHLLGFKSPELIKDINAQDETNIHNLDIVKILDLSPTNILYPYLTNFSKLLNPTFYLICIVLWFVIPLLKWKGAFVSLRSIDAMPVHKSNGIAIFLMTNVIIYLVVDKLLFDIAEIFELALSLTSMMVAFDIYVNYQKDAKAQL